MGVLHIRTILIFAKMIVVSLLLSACAGIHLHNADNAEKANTIDTGFNEIAAQTDAEFEKETQNQEAILAEELSAVRQFAQNDRDAALAIVAASDEKLLNVWMERMFMKRLEKIGVKGNNVNELGVTVEKIKDNLDIAESLANSFAQKISSLNEGLYYKAKLSCTPNGVASIDDKLVKAALEKASIENEKILGTPLTEEDSEEFEETIRDTYKRLEDDCKDWGSKFASLLSDSEDTEFQKVLKDRNRALKDKEDAIARVGKVEMAFKNAKKELEKMTPKEPDKRPSEIIADQISKLRKLVKGGSSLVSLSSELKIIEERLKELDDVLASAAAGNENEDKPELKGTKKRIALALAGLPNLADGFSELGRTLKKPPLTALIMAKGELEARLRATKAELVREQARIELIEKQYAALVDELTDYNMVFILINKAKKEAGSIKPFNLSYQKLAEKKLPKTQRAASAAIALQIQAESRSLRRRYQAEYQIIALDYQAGKELSKARVAQWHAMLGPLISQQKTYHESGVKPEKLASLTLELLKAIGLFTIAAGVN